MNFTLTINTEITAHGGLPVPAGSIFSGSTSGFRTKDNVDHVLYKGAFFKSQADLDAGESALKIKGIHPDQLSEAGRMARTNLAEYRFSGMVSANDFTYNAEIVNNKAQLTAPSFTSFLDQVKSQLAIKLGIDVSSIS